MTRLWMQKCSHLRRMILVWNMAPTTPRQRFFRVRYRRETIPTLINIRKDHKAREAHCNHVCRKHPQTTILMALLVRLALLALLRPTGAVTLALQGGGIRALASDAGLVAGIARVSHLSHLSHLSHNESIYKQSGDSDQTKMDTLNVMRVLQNFDTVSSVSGSSWFAAELFFSNSFVELLKGVLSLCCLCSLSHPLNMSHLSPNARLDQSMFSHINLVLALALRMYLRCLCYSLHLVSCACATRYSILTVHSFCAV